MLQVTDQRTLRKLLRRVDELPTVKDFLTRLATSQGPFADGEPEIYLGTAPSETLLPEFREKAMAVVKKVKENQHLTALLREIQEYMVAHNWDAAQATAKRVLEANPIKPPEKFVKENSNLALASGSIEPVRKSDE